MQNTPKISIVLPVYKTERYLQQCLESIVNQTLKEIEIIIVHDAPTEKEKEIIKSFLQHDKRIKYIINSEPKSLGKARNQGFDIATGEYLGCVDSDDFIALNMFEKLYTHAKKFDADVCFCAINSVDCAKNDFVEPHLIDTKDIPDEFENKAFAFDQISQGVFNLNCNAFNRIYKHSFYLTENLHYPEGVKFEDIIPYFHGMLAAKKIAYINEALYYYRQNRNGSIFNSRNNAPSVIHALDGIVDVFNKYNKYQQYKNRIICLIPQIMLWFPSEKEVYDYVRIFLKSQNLNKKEIKKLPLLRGKIKKILRYPFWLYKILN